eukprot:6152683-Prymnesium_polylepis.1
MEQQAAALERRPRKVYTAAQQASNGPKHAPTEQRQKVVCCERPVARPVGTNNPLIVNELWKRQD